MINVFKKIARIGLPEEERERRATLDELGVRWTVAKDGTITIRGDVDLSYSRMSVLPDMSGMIVAGDFNCAGNRLVTLRGAPKKVTGCFNCGYNRLVSLENGPEEVGGEYACQGNDFKKLKGAPEKFGRFNSSLGDFHTPADIPPALLGQQPPAPVPPAADAAPGTSLNTSVSVGRPITLVPRS